MRFMVDLEVKTQPNHSVGESGGKCGQQEGFGAWSLEKEQIFAHKRTLLPAALVLTASFLRKYPRALSPPGSDLSNFCIGGGGVTYYIYPPTEQLEHSDHN